MKHQICQINIRLELLSFALCKGCTWTSKKTAPCPRAFLPMHLRNTSRFERSRRPWRRRRSCWNLRYNDKYTIPDLDEAVFHTFLCAFWKNNVLVWLVTEYICVVRIAVRCDFTDLCALLLVLCRRWSPDRLCTHRWTHMLAQVHRQVFVSTSADITQ